MQCVALAGYASMSFSRHFPRSSPHLNTPTSSTCSSDFQKLLKPVDSMSHQTTSVLLLLSSSLGAGRPLPPYLQLPKAFHTADRFDAVNRALLGIRHIAEPQYGALAAIQICAMSVNRDVWKLTAIIKSLVGEFNFSLFPTSTRGQLKLDSANTLERRKTT